MDENLSVRQRKHCHFEGAMRPGNLTGFKGSLVASECWLTRDDNSIVILNSERRELARRAEGRMPVVILSGVPTHTELQQPTIRRLMANFTGL